MAVKLVELDRCSLADRCKFKNGCIVLNSPDKGARFSPTLKLRLEGLRWIVKCFSFTEDQWR